MGEDLNQEGASMISQDILPFKIEHTTELITPRSGLALFAEVLRTLKVREAIREAFPRPGSNRGYEAWAYIEPVLLMLVGGGRHVEDLREVRDDRSSDDALGVDIRGLARSEWSARSGGDAKGG
jgi:hypothetical protein